MTVNFNYGQHDFEAAKILDDFLPSKLFDSHMHISHVPALGVDKPLCFSDYMRDIRHLIGNREIHVNMIPAPTKAVNDMEQRTKSRDFIVGELDKAGNSVGEIFVMPHDTPEFIENQISDRRIRGVKCYHIYANRTDTFNAGIEEYLPDSAWEITSRHRLSITLHMVRDKAIADEDNRKYIKAMVKKYPDTNLILAHAARAFASWTAIEYIDELRVFDNVYFDFSGVCESPAMTYILKRFGAKRCMWGSDWPISMLAGKCISLGDTFYWINENDLRSFKSATELHPRLVGTESIMALREACIIAELCEDDVENVFYNTAKSLFSI